VPAWRGARPVNIGGSVLGTIATMTALILGLMTASAKSAFDAVDASLKHGATDILALDRALAAYGPDTAPVRDRARGSRSARHTWPEDGGGCADAPAALGGRGDRAVM
jgi:hypothetical protein